MQVIQVKQIYAGNLSIGSNASNISNASNASDASNASNASNSCNKISWWYNLLIYPAMVSQKYSC